MKAQVIFPTLVVGMLLLGAATAQAQTTKPISTATGGGQANGEGPLSGAKVGLVQKGAIPVISLPQSEVQRRAAKHRAVLAAYGISDLKSLGKMTISGNVLSQTGLATPTSAKTNGKPVQIGRIDVARMVVLPRPSASPNAKTNTAADIPQTTAYWAAEEITIPDNSNVILNKDNRFLYLITNKLTIGKNVTFTYERADSTQPSKPIRANDGADGDPPKSGDVGRNFPGRDGATGTNGNPGASFTDVPGPEFEFWVLDMSGTPAIDANGQDGGQGGLGGDGGNGGAGKNGIDGNLKHGAGDGNHGGRGGRAGDGGNGGNGAKGGKFSLYAPQNVVTEFNKGFYVGVNGGAAGAGGSPGLPGNGGAAGQAGKPTKLGNTGTSGTPGATGSGGNPGVAGKKGDNRDPLTDPPLNLVPITANDYAIAFLSPHVATVTGQKSGTSKGIQGETIALTGENFVQSDVVVVTPPSGNPVTATASVTSSKSLTFVVPAVQGGSCSVKVQRASGPPAGSPGTLYILPTLTSTAPAQRIKPGASIKITGSGFTPSAHVFITWGTQAQDMSSDNNKVGTVKFVNSNTLMWTAVRPKAGLPSNPAGEPVEIMVTDSTLNAKSNKLPVTLEPYRMVVFGDSIMWGQGLDEQDKFHTLVQNRLQRDFDNTYNAQILKQVFAHSGASIGWDDSGPGAGRDLIYGEVPTDYPTIRKQAEDPQYVSVADAPYVDLILMDGGHNDMGGKFYLDANRKPADISAKANQVFYVDMKRLLLEIASKYPNATIAVSGYYQIVSNNSDFPTWFELGVVFVGIPPITPLNLPTVAAHSDQAIREANQNLKRAVNEVNQQLGTKRFMFANPQNDPVNGFNAQTTFYAPKTLLYKIGEKNGETPELRSARKSAVDKAISDNSTTRCPDGKLYGHNASAFHPNRDGAKVYAREILKLLGF